MSPSSPFRPGLTPTILTPGGRSTTMANDPASVAPETEAPQGGGILPELLTTAQAAELLQVGERTLWRWSRSGICPKPLKIGRGRQGAVRFRRSELLQWIADGCPRVDGRADR